MTNPLLFKFEGEKQVIQLNNSPGFMYLTSTRFDGLLFSFYKKSRKRPKQLKKAIFS